MNDNLKKPNIERLLATMRGGTADRVPNYEILLEARNVKALLGRDEGTTMAASRGADKNALYTPPLAPELFADICHKTGMDAMTLEALWTPLKYRDEQGNLHNITDGCINEWNDLEKAIKPDWEHDFKPRRDVIRDYVRVARANNLGVIWCVGAFFQCSYFFLCNFNEFLLKFYTDRKFVETLFDICVDYYVKVTEIAIEEGVAVLFFADDIAFKSGTFVEPQSFSEIWMPRARRIIKLGKDAGLPVMFHSCGNLTAVMDSIIMKMGIDVLNPIEPYSMDIYDIKKRYGDKLTLSGNIDIAGPLAFGKPEQVREEVRQHMEKLKPGGRYILSTNHSIMDDIPPENFRAMLDAGLEFGRY
jgi:hypothetical protein